VFPVVAAQMQTGQLPSARLVAHVLAAQVPAVTTSLGSGPTACLGLLLLLFFLLLFLGRIPMSLRGYGQFPCFLRVLKASTAVVVARWQVTAASTSSACSVTLPSYSSRRAKVSLHL